jgi:hypothetical protein
MNTVYSFLVPLFCWASHRITDGLSPTKTARRIQKLWSKPRRSRRAKSNEGELDHPFRLKWQERDSFFDPAVQSILMERHPAKNAAAKAGFRGLPVDAWKAVDQFARTAGSSERSLAEFGVFMRLDPLWISRLLSAVAQAIEARGQQRFPSSEVDRENERREHIMEEWAECWIAHYRLIPSNS